MSLLTTWPARLYHSFHPVLQTDGEAFSLPIAATLAWASQLAYEVDSPRKIEAVLTGWGWTLSRMFAGRISTLLPLTSARGFVASQGGISIIVFTGTEPTRIADWVLDFTVRTTADGIHAGFEAGVDAIWPHLFELFGKGGPAHGNGVFMAGHSLGGALAMVTAFRTIRDGLLAPERVLSVYTFGMPRVGDENFVGNYRAIDNGSLARRSFRLVYGMDAVPELPPMEPPFAFRHVGSVLNCAHGGRFDVDDLVADAPELPRQGQYSMLRPLLSALRTPPSRDLPGFPGNARAAAVIDMLPPPVRDHVPDRYLGALGVLQ